MELVFDGGAPNLEEKNNFVEYLLMFYAEDPKYDAVYPEVAMTREDAIKHTVEYLEGDFPVLKTTGSKMNLELRCLLICGVVVTLSTERRFVNCS